MSDLPPAPRVVRPRARTYQPLPVVAIGDTASWVSESGDVGSISDLLTQLPEWSPTLFAKQGAADFASLLNEHYSQSHPDTWQWRITEQERAIVHPLKMTVAARVTVVVHYFGFKLNGHRYHKLIDPISMYGRGLDDIWPGDDPPTVRLLAWATAIRDFCHENGMEVRPTIGAISSQFWTDHRFYPNARRWVPRAINARAREHLPGNHYALSVAPSPRHEFTAVYLDQKRAHHYHAQTTVMPNANSLYAHGFFQNLSDIAFDEPPENFHGLYCLHLQLPKRHDPMLHWINPNSPHDFVFSNELPILLDMGYKVNGVIAAWGSFERDLGIARYATFANQQLDAHEDAPWLKPLLLAAYGTLATRPSWGQTIFRLASRGEQVSVRTGQRKLSGTLVHAPRKLEPRIANVIHRGMIDAACRADSIGLAHYLTGLGHRILSIYADAVMVEQDDDKTLPILPEPWKVKRTLNHLQFVSKQAFISGEMTKLPGVSNELKAYARRANGHAPRTKTYDALTGQPTTTDRRI